MKSGRESRKSGSVPSGPLVTATTSAWRRSWDNFTWGAIRSPGDAVQAAVWTVVVVVVLKLFGVNVVWPNAIELIPR